MECKTKDLQESLVFFPSFRSQKGEEGEKKEAEGGQRDHAWGVGELRNIRNAKSQRIWHCRFDRTERGKDLLSPGRSHNLGALELRIAFKREEQNSVSGDVKRRVRQETPMGSGTIQKGLDVSWGRGKKRRSMIGSRGGEGIKYGHQAATKSGIRRFSGSDPWALKKGGGKTRRNQKDPTPFKKRVKGTWENSKITWGQETLAGEGGGGD